MKYEQTLADIGDATFKMLELAQTKQWDALAATENKRSELFATLDGLIPLSHNVETIKNQLNEILEINKLITTLASRERLDCKADVQQIKLSQKACKAYIGY